MYRSCKYCGRIHEDSYLCPQRADAEEKRRSYRASYHSKNPKIDSFRKSRHWQAIADYVKRRDRKVCLCCVANLKGTETVFNTEGLSVHHIVPINESWETRTDTDNLITVCRMHHELCENGQISRDKQRELVESSKDGSILNYLKTEPAAKSNPPA